MPKPKDPRSKQFAIQMLTDEPAAQFAAVQQAANAEGIDVQPHHYYRALRELGIDRSRGSATPQPSSSSSALSSLETLVANLRAIHKDRDRYRAVLEQIRKVVREARRSSYAS